MKHKILKHYYLLSSMGYKYAQPFDMQRCQSNEYPLPNSLMQLKSLVQNCSLCAFYKQRTKVDFAQGNENASVMFIDVMPTILEDDQDRLVIGKSGELLINMIENVLKQPHNDFYFANIIKCKTKNKVEPSACEINSCKSYLLKQIELINPKLIVALGQSCYTYLTNDKTNIEQIRGKVLPFNQKELMAIYHPGFLLRNPSCKKEAYVDMLKIKSMLEKM
jgi:DNA polymerase